MNEIKPSVLLVDDVDANLVALEALLGDMPCELVRASGGNAALKHLLKRDFAVMLLDVQMPEIDGYEVARYAREHPATREVPIIFLTAMHHSEDNMLRGYGTGAVDFLLKPINPHVLRSKVRVFLDLYVQRQKLVNEIRSHEATLVALGVANDALRHFTDVASHDLRAPLRAMRGFLDALSERVGEQLDATARDYLERSRNASQRMDSLLNSLLTYARLQKPPAPASVECEALLSQVKIDLASPLTSSAATLEVGALPVVLGDPDRLYQLFLNLVGNAIKFRREGRAPKVTVTAKESGEHWTFCVADDGIGIEPKYQAAIFDAFRRLHTTSKYEGSGLGLMICKQIVEQHGGRIWVESEPNQGSRFCFTLASPKALSA